MRKLLFAAGLLVSLVFCPLSLKAQQDPMAVVKQNYPKLFELFRDEMQNQHANYLFAVDVSGTMKKNAPVVVPALKSFIESLPDGDYVDIVRFGNYAKAGDLGYAGTVDEGFKNSLKNAIDNLYTNTADSDIKGLTDIPKALEAVTNCLKGYSVNDLNFVFLLTDFRNEEVGKAEGKISEQDLKKFEDALLASTVDKSVKVVSLQLEYSPNWAGFCRPQLDGVFDKLDLDYRNVPVADESALSNWFNRLKKDVMYDRLQAIVMRANKEVTVKFDPTVTIDGNVSGDIVWEPNKLYKDIKVNGISVSDGSGFRFKSAGELTADAIQEKSVTLPLGKLRHHSWGFHTYNDNLTADIDLPTPFDNELTGLDIKKPVPDSNIPVKKMVFTFILPLWLTALLLALLIIYIFLVIGAIKRNAKESFTGSIEVYKGRNLIYENDTIKRKNIVNIPGDLNSRGNASVEWSLQLRKHPSNIFLFWKKPTYDLQAQSGVFQDGAKARRQKRGMTPGFLKNRTFYCGIDSDHMETHSVEIMKKH